MAAKPYDPLSNPLPSIKLITARARRRAHADIVAKLGALPNAAALRAANASLVGSLGASVGDLSKLVGGVQQSYQQTVAPEAAQQRGAAAATGYGAEPVASASRGGLLGMLGASQVGALQGTQTAARAALPGQLNELAGKMGGIRGSENALFEQYYQQGLDDALKTSAARANATLATQGLNLKADTAAAADQRSAERNAIAQERNNIARDRVNASINGTGDKALKKAMADAAKAMNAALGKSGKKTVTTGGTYYFDIPNVIPGQKPKHVPITAKNGNAAEAAFLAWAKTANLAGYNYDPKQRGRNYFTGEMKPITSTVATGGSRSQALNAAVTILLAAGMDKNTAYSTARSWLPKVKKAKKKKPPVDHVGGPH